MNSLDSSDNLPILFQRASDLVDGLKESSIEHFEENVRSAISSLETCTKMVSSLQLFSKNESVEEISTSSLQYLLLPALLGDMTNILPLNSPEARLPNLRNTISYYDDFLKRCQNYELCNDVLLSSAFEKNESQSIEAQLQQRSKLIAKYKERKQLRTMMENLRKTESSTDEESCRKILLLKIQIAIEETQHTLSHLIREKQMLDERFNNKIGELPDKYAKHENISVPSLHKPAVLILTRDQVQKAVFGAGYPSVPTMTLDEWYEQQCGSCSDGGATERLPERGLKSRTGDPELDSQLERKEKIEREEWQEERDDASLIQKRRNFDDYKDDHRRGSGNTIGKG